MTSPSNRPQIAGIVSGLNSILSKPIPALSFLDSVVPIPTLLERSVRSLGNGRRSSSPRRRSAVRVKNGRKAPVMTSGPGFSAEGRIAVRGIERYAVDELEFQITESTWIIGVLKEGAVAKVSGDVFEGNRTARQVVVLR